MEATTILTRGDCLSDVHGHDHLSHVVIVSCDSDFIPLVQRVKQAGRFVAGVGVTGRSSRFLVSACNEYKFYENLLPAKPKADPEMPAGEPVKPLPPEAGTADLTEVVNGDGVREVSATTQAVAGASDAPIIAGAALAAELGSSAPSLSEVQPVLLEVMHQLAEREENYIFCGKVKQGIKRRLPAFDEQALGFSSFKMFLQHFPALLTFVDHDGGGHVALIEAPALPGPLAERTSGDIGDGQSSESAPVTRLGLAGGPQA